MTSLVNKVKLLIVAIIPTISFICCSSNKTETNILSVTIEPQRYFLEQIVGDKFKVISLVPSGANPESFDPTPSQMMALDNSRGYFRIGFLGIESSLIDKIKNQSSLEIANCSKGITIIGDDHDHSSEESLHHDGHEGGDPHYWSSITSAKQILNNMYDMIIKIDTSNQIVYTNNYNNELQKINNTDSIIKSYLSQSDTKAFVIYHPALSYFADEYNLEQLSIEHDGKNPSPTQLKKLIDEAKEKKVKVVFIQAEFDSKNAEVIANQIGAATYSINLLSYDWHAEMINIAKAIAGIDE